MISVHEAHALEHYVLPPVHVKRGDADAALKRAPHQLEGRFEVGGQEHFYLEGQVAYVLPLEQNQWWVYTSTQHPGEVQHWVSHALGIANHAVTVECRRMGGGFGGKETQAGHLAVWAAVAANRLQCPIKLRLDRDDDFMITGKRHPFAYHYRVGFDDTGLLCGMALEMLANCGFSADLSGPVADRAIFHADNAYFLEDVAISSYRCKTNTQSHTAFRGFGGPQGVIVIERILSDIARTLDLDPLDVRLRNLYGITERNVTHYQMVVEDNILDPLINQLALTSGYRERREQIATWNARSPVIKRGLSLTPVKFGISFTATLFNQAGALVHVYTDGSAQVNHGGTEMGQGLNTKIAQIVADELGIPFERVLATAADTSKVPNASATAASAGTDLNGRAAQFAARTVRNNLAAFVAGLDGVGAGAVRFEGGRVVTEKTDRSFEDGGRRGLRQPHPALERWLLPHTQDPLRQNHPHRPALLLLRLWRRLHRSGHRHADRREPCVEGRHPARRGPQHQPGDRHRPDRRRLRAGHGLAHHRTTGLESQWHARHARPQHLQNSRHRGHTGPFQGGPLARSQPRRQRARQQGRGRAALHAGDQRV